MRRKLTLAERFWNLVDSGSPNECWLWKGSQAGAGYGVLPSAIGHRHMYAHRIAYELHVGPIPDGLEIDHLCRTRLCVNPAHLEPVTHAENRRRARKTFCKRGHELSEGRERLGHGRLCRKCDALRASEYRARKKTSA